VKSYDLLGTYRTAPSDFILGLIEQPLCIFVYRRSNALDMWAFLLVRSFSFFIISVQN